jgi:hypothetical protein
MGSGDLSAALAAQFGSGPFDRGAGCKLPGHYSELQALCDALGHAAQAEMADAILRSDPLGRERAYGKWLGLRGILRAVEARTDEWTPIEAEMLERIDWEQERFVFPGSEAFDIARSEPGQPHSH